MFISVITGESFTADTVILKLSLVVEIPSDTETVIFAVPFLSSAGFTIIVLFPSDPPRIRFVFVLGTRAGLSETAVTARRLTMVSESETVNGIIAVEITG